MSVQSIGETATESRIYFPGFGGKKWPNSTSECCVPLV